METKKIALSVIFILFSFSVFGQNEPTVPLKDYVDMQSQLNKELMLKLIEIHNNNINDNVTKANAAMEKRLDGMNEFRDTLKDQNSTFVTKGEIWTGALALIGLFFGYAQYMRGKNGGKAEGNKSIMSGDKVEVKK